MKVGDLVAAKRGTKRVIAIEGYIGIIVGFDEDDDPIVYWTHALDEAIGHQSEYRSHICVLNES